MRRTVLATATVAAALGVFPLAACGSDHTGATTAPTTLAAAPATASTNAFKPMDHGGGDDRSIEGEGRVGSLVAGIGCPTLAFMVGTVKVTLTAATTFEGGTCASIRVGSDVEVKGTRQADGSILATNVELKAEDQDENEPVDGEDVITAIKAGTSCPNLTFMIGVKAISVTAATDIHPGTCADVAVGREVGVKGIVTAEHQVLGQQIVFKGPGN